MSTKKQKNFYILEITKEEDNNATMVGGPYFYSEANKLKNIFNKLGKYKEDKEIGWTRAERPEQRKFVVAHKTNINFDGNI